MTSAEVRLETTTRYVQTKIRQLNEAILRTPSGPLRNQLITRRETLEPLQALLLDTRPTVEARRSA